MTATHPQPQAPATMKRAELLLALLAAAEGAHYTPVQLQKSMFLLDRNVLNGNPEGIQLKDEGYNFEPYHYGPFDPAVYRDAEDLSREGLVLVSHKVGSPVELYCATQEGIASGQQLLAGMSERCRVYITNVSEWTRSLGFKKLVASIYDAYPDMEVNSIFTRSA